MKLRTQCLIIVLFAATAVASAATGSAPTTGILLKRPVFGGACKLCPWGALAEVVKQAMRPYGYDVRICYNCNGAAAPRIVANAELPPPYRRDANVSVAMAPPNAPGLGPVDFGATAVSFLCSAYNGTGIYAGGKPMKNLRLIANIQSPWYLLVASKATTGITNLSQVRQKRWPVRIFASPNDPMVREILAYYGLSVKSIVAAGGYVGNSRADRATFDIIIQGGTLSTAPEWNVWYEVSQKFDLKYLQLPHALLVKLARVPQASLGIIPVGLLRGIDRPIPTVVRDGTAIYCRADAPDNFAYDVARAMDQHQDLLQWTNQNFSYNIHNVWKACDVPLHPGAASYYRAVGYMK